MHTHYRCLKSVSGNFGVSFYFNYCRVFSGVGQLLTKQMKKWMGSIIDKHGGTDVDVKARNGKARGAFI